MARWEQQSRRSSGSPGRTTSDPPTRLYYSRWSEVNWNVFPDASPYYSGIIPTMCGPVQFCTCREHVHAMSVFLPQPDPQPSIPPRFRYYKFTIGSLAGRAILQITV